MIAQRVLAILLRFAGVTSRPDSETIPKQYDPDEA
jgi:hypothetical protein